MKRKVQKSLVTAVVCVMFGLALLVACSAPSPSTSSASQPIKVGFAAGLSGPSAALIRTEVAGVEMAVEDINNAGGLLGRKVQLLIRDEQFKPDIASQLTMDLITREKVDLMLGPSSSASALATNQISKQYKKVMMMVGPNTPRLTMEEFQPYMFTLSPSGLMEARAWAQVAGEKFTKYAYIGPDYEAGRQTFKYFSEQLPKVNPNGKVLVDVWPKLGETDFSPYITKLLSSAPEFVYSSMFGADVIGFVKQAKAYGFFDKVKFGTMTYLDDLKAMRDDMPENILIQMRAPFFAMPDAASFNQRFFDKTGDTPGDFAFVGYEGMMALAQGVKQAGSLDQDAIVKALESITYQGPRGKITFRKEDHQATVPSFIGTSVKSDKYSFRILKDVQAVPAEKIWPSVQEIEASRKK